MLAMETGRRRLLPQSMMQAAPRGMRVASIPFANRLNTRPSLDTTGMSGSLLQCPRSGAVPAARALKSLEPVDEHAGTISVRRRVVGRVRIEDIAWHGEAHRVRDAALRVCEHGHRQCDHHGRVLRQVEWQADNAARATFRRTYASRGTRPCCCVYIEEVAVQHVVDQERVKVCTTRRVVDGDDVRGWRAGLQKFFFQPKLHLIHIQNLY